MQFSLTSSSILRMMESNCSSWFAASVQNAARFVFECRPGGPGKAMCGYFEVSPSHLTKVARLKANFGFPVMWQDAIDSHDYRSFLLLLREYMETPVDAVDMVRGLAHTEYWVPEGWQSKLVEIYYSGFLIANSVRGHVLDEKERTKELRWNYKPQSGQTKIEGPFLNFVFGPVFVIL